MLHFSLLACFYFCLLYQASSNFIGGLGLRVPPLNGTADSKFIVRPMEATLIGDDVAMGLQFIKNRRLIVQGQEPQSQTIKEIRGLPGKFKFIITQESMSRSCKEHKAKNIKQRI